MHSEFACHIGLRGKFFCRSCWVKGSDDAGHIFLDNDGAGSRLNSPAPSSAGSEVEANTIATNNSNDMATNEVLPDGSSTQPSTSCKRKKNEESYTAMLDRVSAFVKVCLILFRCGSPYDHLLFSLVNPATKLKRRRRSIHISKRQLLLVQKRS